ncbi:MAG: hypothetical protein ACRBCK_11740 [Alphaproteobacteria bacterium]
MRHDVFHVLKGNDVLALWEAGASQPPDRVMDMLLSAVLPEGAPFWIRDASVGQKNAVLLRLYQRWFGDALSACVECPSCGEKLETRLQASDILSAVGDELPKTCMLDDGRQMRFPGFSDLQTADAFQDEKNAVLSLLRSCLIDSDGMSDGDVLAYRSEVECAIEKHDPLFLISLELHCNECDTSFESVLDIAHFLMQNFSGLAKGMLYDVHVLAQHYGWKEGDILNMSMTRRKAYMRLIEG